MYLLDGAIRNYAWGSHQELAALRGAPTPTEHPEAEMWFGTHSGDPALLATDNDRTLRDVVAADPTHELGSATAHTFADNLPFLLKLLAAEEPLSLQAHPSLAQAQEGYARENAQGVPLDAPDRNYHDPNHKPELIVGLTRFHALAGFREPQCTLELFDALNVPQLQPYVEMLRAEPDATGIRAVMTTLITLTADQLRECITATQEAAQRLVAANGEWVDESVTFLGLVSEYGNDAGALCALLLNRITLEPGEAIFMKSGMLHAYLHGVGVEIMANSDNVLRGGLTSKHIDVPELMHVVQFDALLDPIAPAENVVLSSHGIVPAEGIETVEYLTPVPEFRLSRSHLAPCRESHLGIEGPFIVLVTEGTVTLTSRECPEGLSVSAGHAAWVGAWEDRPTIATGENSATVFIARVP